MRVLFDVFSIKFARHHAVRPSRVKQHDWKEDQRYKEHDLKRELGAGAVPKRQTVIEHRLRRHHKWEHRKKRRQYDSEKRNG